MIEIDAVFPLVPTFEAAVSQSPGIDAELTVSPVFADVALLPTGPKGDPGTGTAQTTTGLAALALSGHRAVIPQPDGSLTYDDSSILALRVIPPSITTSAYATGALASAILFGDITEPSWDWTPDMPIYLGPSGMLTQTVPMLAAGDAFLMQIAVAISATTIFWNPQVPIVLV